MCRYEIFFKEYTRSKIKNVKVALLRLKWTKQAYGPTLKGTYEKPFAYKQKMYCIWEVTASQNDILEEVYALFDEGGWVIRMKICCHSKVNWKYEYLEK